MEEESLSSCKESAAAFLAMDVLFIVRSLGNIQVVLVASDGIVVVCVGLLW